MLGRGTMPISTKADPVTASPTSKTKKSQLPIKLRAGGKTDVRTQFAALCYRYKKDELQICMVTSRGSGRWILPKGWPMHKQTPAQAAAQEAWEEAGLKGAPIDHCLGVYSALKPLENETAPLLVMVYPVRVETVAKNWPEMEDRKRKWVSARKAAKKLTEPELRRIVSTFDPTTLKG